MSFLVRKRLCLSTLDRSIRFKYLFCIPHRSSFLIREDEEHQKAFMSRKTGGNKITYSDLYIKKRNKKASKTFWSSYKRIFSAFILGTATLFGFIFIGHRFYEQYQKEAGRQITEKLASNKQDQEILNKLATDIANKYISSQFNKLLINDKNLETGFKHIPRHFTLIQSSISDIIYRQDRTAWNIFVGFNGAGISSIFKDAFNDTINDIDNVLNNHSTKYEKETVKKKSFLYLNFQEINDSKDCLESLIKYHWNNNEFDINHYSNKLPQSIDEYDVLRKALLIAIRNKYVENGKKYPVILVIDSLDELILKDLDFKFWIMLFGAAIQQRMISIVSVSGNGFGMELIQNILATTYGNIGNLITKKTMKNEPVQLEIIQFFSEKEIYQILELNMDDNNKYINYKLLATKLHEITKGYPILISAMILAINTNKLSINDILNDEKQILSNWFDQWYENEYFIKYIVPGLKIFKATSKSTSEIAAKNKIINLIKKSRAIIIDDVSLEDKLKKAMNNNNNNNNSIDQGTIDNIIQYIEMAADATNVLKTGILFPKRVEIDNDIKGSLPIIKDYWKRHSSNQISEKLLTLMQDSADSDS